MGTIVWLLAAIGGIAVTAILTKWIVTLQSRANLRTAPGSPERLSRLRLSLGEDEGLIDFLSKLDNIQLGDFNGAVGGIIHALDRGIDIRPELYRQLAERGVDFPYRARAELNDMDKGKLLELRRTVDAI